MSKKSAWLGILTLVSAQVFAQDAKIPAIPCASIETYAGEVQILSPDRNQLNAPAMGAAIACDGWLSIGKGWARIRHKDGFLFRVGPGTALRISEKDQVTLLEGTIYAHAGNGTGELRLLSANATARVSRGTVLFLFSPGEKETQLLALDSQASLENRFEPSRRMKVSPGESTSLNFKLLRVIPSAPKAISLVALKPKLMDLRVEAEAMSVALDHASSRAQRTMAAQLTEEVTPAESAHATQVAKTETAHGKESYAAVTPTAAPSRGLASVPSAKANGQLEHEKLEKHWINRLVAGENDGEKILFPDRYQGKSRKVQLQISPRDASASGAGDAERNRLIQELSQVREE